MAKEKQEYSIDYKYLGVSKKVLDAMKDVALNLSVGFKEDFEECSRDYHANSDEEEKRFKTLLENRNFLSAQNIPLDMLRRIRNQYIINSVTSKSNKIAGYGHGFSASFGPKLERLSFSHLELIGELIREEVYMEVLEDIKECSNFSKLALKEDWRFCQYFANDCDKK